MRMVAGHGGTAEDYVVTQATITPYIITCPTTRIRDAIVRRGIYTIPHTDIQFKVHEWRPRFGMGYDPPTHQIWIKLVGLPLQAWTAPQVSKFIQNFAYPLQVLPFGQAAGHYRDITALVAAKHPSRIPLAYMYREGDYSTQVDVVLLAWRPWEDDHFPPPQNPMPQENHQQQFHQNNENTVSAAHSSSSSANNVPSEPTVDYSSWSPRSFNIYSTPLEKWVPKLSQVTKIGPISPCQGNEPDTINKAQDNHDSNILSAVISQYAFSPSSSKWLSKFSGNDRYSLLLHHPQRPSTPATVDPHPLHESPCIYSVILAYIPSTPSPILPNPLLFLQAPKRHNRTLKTARLTYPSPSSHATPLLPSAPLMTLVLSESYKSPTQMVFLAHRKEYSGIRPGPLWPKSLNTSARLLCSPQAQADNSTNPPFSPSQAHDFVIPIPDHTESLLQFLSCDMSEHVENHSESVASVPHVTLSSSSELPVPTDQFSPTTVTHSSGPVLNGETPDMPVKTPLLPAITAPESNQILNSFSPRSSAKKKNKMARGKQLPTRRSQRIQAKGRITQVTARTSGKTEKRTKALHFDLPGPGVPLNKEAVLTILQASGLEISEQIEKMVREAADQSQIPQSEDHEMPLTPLHDPIPPLAIPGFDLLL